jgi:hypothetical protein
MSASFLLNTLHLDHDMSLAAPSFLSVVKLERTPNRFAVGKVEQVTSYSRSGLSGISRDFFSFFILFYFFFKEEL